MYTCPICDYQKLEYRDNYDEMICLQCGNKFNIKDFKFSSEDIKKYWKELRDEWIADGKPFWWESLKFLPGWKYPGH